MYDAEHKWKKAENNKAATNKLEIDEGRQINKDGKQPANTQ